MWRAGPLNLKKSKNEHSEGGQKRQKRLRWSGQGGFLFVRFWCERTVTAIEVGGSSTWYHLNHCRKDAQPRRREEHEKELGAGVPGTERPPQDQT